MNLLQVDEKVTRFVVSKCPEDILFGWFQSNGAIFEKENAVVKFRGKCKNIEERICFSGFFFAKVHAAFIYYYYIIKISGFSLDPKGLGRVE